MCPQDLEPDLLPADPLDATLAQMDRILCEAGLGGAGDVNTLKRRRIMVDLDRLARRSVAIAAQREVEAARRELDSARERRSKDERVIRTLAHMGNYYADRHTWQAGVAVHVNAFDVNDVWLDEGECAREALRAVSWAFPR